ncbi:hypothetical protein MCW82_07125 [Azospirillum doebereinerae]|uniref:hypothetical protein n=1 Tax=Azospirillum doebereinerae TaxID=92933 RepID=UPI001EE54544|nr:hypothetical protein [Azospirillum doebereinerae]MCG5239539.1 hypothetical protein [Azospirillum doebereinerae]
MDGGAVFSGRADDDDAQVVTGRLRDLPERGDPVVPGLAGGRGWVAIQYARGRLDAAQLAAAVDIGRGLIVDGSVACGLRAVDPSRLVVDGGNRTSPPLAPSGGLVSLTASPAARRLAEWRRSVREDRTAGVLRGRAKSLWLDLVVVRVVMGEVSPAALDVELGLRKERTRDAVLRALADYAATFGLTVPKITS